MKALGKDLIFISQIKRDGSGVKKRITKSHVELMADETFALNRLSISQDTYLACGFNSFVVKRKKPVTTDQVK